jgi:hypothetical protein
MAIAIPIFIKINNSNYPRTPVRGGENNSYVLTIVRGAFKRIFGIRMGSGFAFAEINGPLLQNFLYLAFVDMPATHAATGMFGIYKMIGIAVNRNIIRYAHTLAGAEKDIKGDNYSSQVLSF